MNSAIETDKGSFLPPLTFFFKWRIQWRVLSCSYQQAMKWGTSASVFNSFVCSFESVKQKPQSAHREKKSTHDRKTQEKSHKQKRQTANIFINPPKPTKPQTWTQIAGFCNHICSVSFPCLGCMEHASGLARKNTADLRKHPTFPYIPTRPLLWQASP